MVVFGDETYYQILNWKQEKIKKIKTNKLSI